MQGWPHCVCKLSHFCDGLKAANKRMLKKKPERITSSVLSAACKEVPCKQRAKSLTQAGKMGTRGIHEDKARGTFPPNSCIAEAFQFTDPAWPSRSPTTRRKIKWMAFYQFQWALDQTLWNHNATCCPYAGMQKGR